MGENLESQSGGAGSSSDKINGAIMCLTVLSYLVSVLVVATGIWLLCMKDYECEELLRLPRIRILIGIAMLAVFVASNAVVHSKNRMIIPAYLGIMALMILMFILGLVLAGKYPMESRGVPGTPLWLKTRVSDNRNWANIRLCINDAGICSDLAITTSTLNSYQFSMKKLSPIESGCCRPPTSCGMQYMNATYWLAPNQTADDIGSDDGSGSSSTGVGTKKWFPEGDCHEWSNKCTQLCYDCLSCKAGYLGTLQRRWWHLGNILISTAALLSLIHSIRFVLVMMQLRGT
ncbi:Tetraspanin-15 [Nymphaea thermarum]|nr:Tetraspanin-15 [Nymphaea thermarum]